MFAMAWGLGVQSDWEHWLGCWLVAVNVVAFGYYGFDKGRSRGVESRVPEWALHGLTAAGGSLGAYAGMHVFRHKTLKRGFRIVFWCIVVLEMALILWLIRAMW
jgi:uncharacterized membrane protein YsdA (DUF1294 family)